MRETALPAPTGDITSVSDVHDLVVEFYRDVVFDDLLAPVFGEVVEVDWAEHIPKLIDYWARILLGAPGGVGPIMSAHRHVHSLEPVTVELCDRWFMLWSECVAQSWQGPVAERAVEHAAAIMEGMARHVFDIEWVRPAALGRTPASPATAGPARADSVRADSATVASVREMVSGGS